MIKAIAIDDEPLALRQINTYVSKCEGIELVKTFLNPHEALDFLDSNFVELIFVDINMPDMSGIEFIKAMKTKNMVIFTTAYSEYAIEGYKLNVIDYLLKPISLDDFKRSIRKVEVICNLYTSAMKNEASAENEEEYISIKADYKVMQIKISEILYLVSAGEYVRLLLVDGSSVLTLMRLKNIETMLPSTSFIRTHRSYIVNFNHISSYTKGRVFVEGGHILPIGDNFKECFITNMESRG